MFFKLILESFFALILANLISNTLTTWHQYNSCYSPTPLFLIEAYILTFLSRVAHLLQTKSPFSLYIKTRMTLIISWLLYPGIAIVIVEGISFYILNNANTPNCGPNEGRGMLYLNLVPMGLLLLANIGSLAEGLWATLYGYLDNMFDAVMGTAMQEETINYMMSDQGTETLLVNWLGTDLKDKIGLSMAEREKILKQTVSEKDLDIKEKLSQETCSVCYEDFKNGENVHILPRCNHVFHIDCVDTWLSKSPVCPMCRANVRVNLKSEAI